MTTREDAVRLAESIDEANGLVGIDGAWLERFYTLARNEALREAAEVCEKFDLNEYNFMPKQCASAILALVKEV